MKRFLFSRPVPHRSRLSAAAASLLTAYCLLLTVSALGQAVVNRDRLSLLRDVGMNAGSLTTGQVLRYSGSAWVNTTLGWSMISGTPTTLAGYGITDAQPALPSQSGHSGQFLSTNGSALSWAAAGANFDPHSPGAIGDTTPGTGAFTGLTASGSAGTLLHVFNSAVGHDVLGVDSNGVLTGGNILVQGVYAQTGVSATQIRLGVNPQGAAPDVYLLRAAANALALRNGTNGQTLDISRTFTDASNYSQLAIDATGNTVAFRADEAGTGVGTLTGYSFDRALAVTSGVRSDFSGPINSSSYIQSQLGFAFNFRGVIVATADGVFALYRGDSTDFNRLQFGGTTSGEPSLKKSGADLIVRLADDSADTGIGLSSIIIGGVRYYPHDTAGTLTFTTTP